MTSDEEMEYMADIASKTSLPINLVKRFSLEDEQLFLSKFVEIIEQMCLGKNKSLEYKMTYKNCHLFTNKKTKTTYFSLFCYRTIDNPFELFNEIIRAYHLSTEFDTDECFTMKWKLVDISLYNAGKLNDFDILGIDDYFKFIGITLNTDTIDKIYRDVNSMLE